MEITIFKEVTTEGVISSIEENSKKYHDGLYANMNNLPERTMVKKGAAEIGDIIKELKASRIKITKANTAAVNKEHDAIVERLQVANKPFTDLLDAYNVVRKKELAAEAARKKAIEDQVKFEADHEFALLLNKTFEYDRDEAAKAQDEEFKRVMDLATKAAEERALSKAAHAKAVKVNEENARLANKEHVRHVNRRARGDLMSATGLSEKEAQKVIESIVQNKIFNTSINY